MAFAQLTHRESLRDVEACLRAVSSKLYHLGIRGPVSRSTLADANERRDWRVYAAWHKPSSPSHARCTPMSRSASTLRSPSTPWTPPPLMCAYRFVPGLRFNARGER